MSATRRWRLLAGWAVALVTPGTLAAQAASLPVTLAAPVARRDEAVRVQAMPRSVQVIAVPVPPGLESGAPVMYTVMPTGGATIIGPLRGTVAGGERSVLVTASVPRGALAGEHVIAEVEFAQPGALVRRVPVELGVLQVRNVVVRLTEQLLAARPGDRITLRYVVTNTGNSRDSFDLSLAPPPGWTVEGVPMRYVLDAGESATGEVRLTLPVGSVTGAVPLRVIVSDRRQELARAEAVVEVLETARGRGVSGPVLTAGVASVLADSGRTSPVLGLELSGQVSNEVRVFGRLVQATDAARLDARGLARVGYFIGSPFITVAGPHWQFTGGTTGRSFSDVTGVNLYGNGVSFGWDGPRWSLAGLAAKPVAAGTTPASGDLLGAQLSAKIGTSRVGVTATDLRDPQFGGRQLQAVGVNAVTAPFQGVTVAGEIAQRSFGTGTGIGWSTEIKRQSGTEFAQVRVVQAPGGSAAFARAETEASAVVSHGIGHRVVLGYGFWTTRDETATFSGLRSVGWSIGPRFALSERTALEVETRSTAFDASGAAGAFGNSELVLRVGLSTQRGALYASGSGIVGSSTRSAALPGAPAQETSAGRLAARALTGWATERGTFEASASVERNGVGTGYLPRQYVVGVRAQRVTLASGRGAPVLTAEVQRYGWFGDRPALTVARVGAQVPLPGDMALTVDVEHNPFLQGVGPRASWIPVVKLEHRIHVPFRVTRPAAQGIVFQDLNANGVRDHGEPPLRGAVVRRGDETTVTDGSGRFRFSERTDAPVRLDEKSLPFGMVANPVPAASEQPLRDLALGVLATATVEVRLVPTADEDGRRPNVTVDGVTVRAVDQSGSAWTARADSAGRARFYALPPGSYHLEFDFAGLREPVRLRGEVPGFVVQPGREIPPVVVPLFPRPIRLFDPAHPGSPGSRGGSQP